MHLDKCVFVCEGEEAFIYSCCHLLISFEIDYFYGMRKRIYKVPPKKLHYRNYLIFLILLLNEHVRTRGNLMKWDFDPEIKGSEMRFALRLFSVLG